MGFFDSKSCYTGSSDSTVKLWDLNKGNLIQTYVAGSKCFSSANDGYNIYTGHQNGTIKLWSTVKKTAAMEKKIHSGGINYILLSSDNNSLVGDV